MILRVMASGNTLCLHIPKALVTRMRLSKGDGVYAHEIPNGYAITSFVEEFARDMDLSDEALDRDREMLQVLETLELP